jgi:hypothetical protein
MGKKLIIETMQYKNLVFSGINRKFVYLCSHKAYFAEILRNSRRIGKMKKYDNSFAHTVESKVYEYGFLKV